MGLMGRFVVFSGTPSSPGGFRAFPTSTPTAGGPVDGCEGSDSELWGPRWGGKGTPIHVEAGESFSDGVDLATDGQGRAVQAGSGDEVVARSLEGSSGAGDEVWAVLR